MMLPNKRRLIVFSSFSQDTIINGQGVKIGIKPGGPALFIRNALTTVSIPFSLSTGKVIDVEILLKSEGEFGRIQKLPNKHFCSLPMSNWIIVSTILDEWQFDDPLPARLFVDLQGYVRDGSDFGAKRSNENINRLAGKIFCLKGTKEEISYLSNDAIARQKKQILLITDAANGVELYNKGRYTYLPVNKINGLTDSIGAGDTFFAYFVASMFIGTTPTNAARYAINQTYQFLSKEQIKEMPS